MSKRSVLVVGGGIAGVAAATLLAERGARAILLEREATLGGRAGGWKDCLKDGTVFEMGRGLQTFGRHYANARGLLRRIDPALSFLTPLEDAPLLGPNSHRLSLSDLPTRAPFNVLSVLSRSGGVGVVDLLRAKLVRAGAMLSFDPVRTYRDLDRTSAKEFLDGLRLPTEARRTLFEIAARDSFHTEADLSAAELVAMFHFHFAHNPDGLAHDVATEPLSIAIWKPFERYLKSIGVEVHLRHECEAVERIEPDRFLAVSRSRGVAHRLEVDGIVLATAVPPLQKIVGASPALASLAASVAGLGVARPFAVQRVWLDRACGAHRAPLVRVAGYGRLDAVAILDRFEGESRRWARATGGSVIELRACGVPSLAEDATLRSALIEALRDLYPEARSARVVDDRILVRRDAPAFGPASHGPRPTVESPLPGITFAGDFVKLPFPSALLERAVSSGFMAANTLLARFGLPTSPVAHGPTRGIFASASR